MTAIIAVLVAGLLISAMAFFFKALNVIKPKLLRLNLKAGQLINVELEMQSAEDPKNDDGSSAHLPSLLRSPHYQTCYQQTPAGVNSIIIAHAVSAGDPAISVAGEPLAGLFTAEEWPGDGPACTLCAQALFRTQY